MPVNESQSQASKNIISPKTNETPTIGSSNLDKTQKNQINSDDNAPRENRKISMQTQTSAVVDSCVQTSLDTTTTQKRAKKASKETPSEFEVKTTSKNEIPTRDTVTDKKQGTCQDKRRMFVSSPKKTLIHYASSSESLTSESSKNGANTVLHTNVDQSVARVLSVNEHFIATAPAPGYRVTHPRTSRSPVNFAKQRKTIKESVAKKQVPVEKQSLASTLTSTVTSSIYSTITNVTIPTTNHSKNSSTVAQSSELEKQADFEKTISTYNNTNDRTLAKKEESNKIQNYLERLNDDEANDDYEIFETDEILQILFRKTYYYQLKLK